MLIEPYSETPQHPNTTTTATLLTTHSILELVRIGTYAVHVILMKVAQGYIYIYIVWLLVAFLSRS